MQLGFKEIYTNDGYIIPLFEIQKEKCIFNNLKYNIELEDVYILDLNNCIDNFDTINLINYIFNKYNFDFIDKDLWKRFLIDKYNDDKNEYKKATIIKPIKPDLSEDVKYKPLNNYKTKIEYNNLKELWVSSESLNNCHKVNHYQDLTDNEDNYKYIVLNIIFSSNINFKIKRCKQCGKPFITNNQNFETCHRLFKDNITCNKYAEKVRKQHQYDEPIKHLIKNVRDKLKGNYEELENFNDELTTKKEEYLNDKKAFVKWILNTYYFTDDGRKKVVERLDLSKYL